jgi:hypothetical protein
MSTGTGTLEQRLIEAVDRFEKSLAFSAPELIGMRIEQMREQIRDALEDEGDEVVPAPDPQPPGRYGRIEIPGYRENEGWISEETRFGLQVAVVRDREGTETAAIGMGPLCRVVWLPVPETRPEPPALPPGTGWDDGPDGGDGDLGDDDDEYPGAF